MANRRGRGEGSIAKRADGLWEARIDVGHDSNGKRLRKSVYGETKKECADKLTKLANRKLDGVLIDTGRMTVGNLLDRWLNDSARMNVAPTTFQRYSILVNKHLKPRIGGLKLSLLQPLHVQTMLSAMEQDKVGAETRRYSSQVLKRALNVAEQWGLVIRNACRGVDLPKVVRREISPLTMQQAETLLRMSDDAGHGAIFALALATGMRVGELFALHWSSINLETGVLSVLHTLEEVQGKLRLKSPKSKSGRRQIKLPAMAVDALWKQKRALLVQGLAAVEMVFPDADGGYLRKSNFDRRVWKPLRTAAGIPETVVFHDLRHTSASLLLKAGTHIKIVQERLGHSTCKLTLDTYSHLMDGMQDEAALKLDGLLSSKSKSA